MSRSFTLMHAPCSSLQFAPRPLGKLAAGATPAPSTPLILPDLEHRSRSSRDWPAFFLQQDPGPCLAHPSMLSYAVPSKLSGDQFPKCAPPSASPVARVGPRPQPGPRAARPAARAAGWAARRAARQAARPAAAPAVGAWKQHRYTNQSIHKSKRKEPPKELEFWKYEVGLKTRNRMDTFRPSFNSSSKRLGPQLRDTSWPISHLLLPPEICEGLGKLHAGTSSLTRKHGGRVSQRAQRPARRLNSSRGPSTSADLTSALGIPTLSHASGCHTPQARCGDALTER